MITILIAVLGVNTLLRQSDQNFAAPLLEVMLHLLPDLEVTITMDKCIDGKPRKNRLTMSEVSTAEGSEVGAVGRPVTPC